MATSIPDPVELPEDWMKPPKPAGPGYEIPDHIMNDLASRFIINVTEEERNNLIRLMWQVEQAHWYYLDFLTHDPNEKLKPCTLKEFTVQMFKHLPFLRKNLGDLETIYAQWRDYKASVPTYGAVLLDESLKHVLLVQGYNLKGSWGFPKGKVNQDEPAVHCAVREVKEETGYDISNLIDPRDFLEARINDQRIRLYVVSGISMDATFKPKTRGEIKTCAWFDISTLPANKTEFYEMRDALAHLKKQLPSMFMVMPFVKHLRYWIERKKAKQPKKKQSLSELRMHLEAVFASGSARSRNVLSIEGSAFKEVRPRRTELSPDPRRCPAGQCLFDFSETDNFAVLDPYVVWPEDEEDSLTIEVLKKEMKDSIKQAVANVLENVADNMLKKLTTTTSPTKNRQRSTSTSSKSKESTSATETPSTAVNETPPENKTQKKKKSPRVSQIGQSPPVQSPSTPSSTRGQPQQEKSKQRDTTAVAAESTENGPLTTPTSTSLTPSSTSASSLPPSSTSASFLPSTSASSLPPSSTSASSLHPSPTSASSFPPSSISASTHPPLAHSTPSRSASETRQQKKAGAGSKGAGRGSNILRNYSATAIAAKVALQPPPLLPPPSNRFQKEKSPFQKEKSPYRSRNQQTQRQPPGPTAPVKILKPQQLSQKPAVEPLPASRQAQATGATALAPSAAPTTSIWKHPPPLMAYNSILGSSGGQAGFHRRKPIVMVTPNVIIDRNGEN